MRLFWAVSFRGFHGRSLNRFRRYTDARMLFSFIFRCMIDNASSSCPASALSVNNYGIPSHFVIIIQSEHSFYFFPQSSTGLLLTGTSITSQPAAVHSPPCRFDPHLLLEEFRKYMCHRGITHWDGCLVLPDAWVYLHHIHSVRHYPSTFILFTTIQPFSQPYTIRKIQVDPSSSRQRLTAERTSCMNS